MTTVERLIAKLEKVASDERYPESVRKQARIDADGYRAAAVAKGVIK